MNDNTIRPLAGIRVLELGNYIAAPTAGRMLADFGAEVIKVERPVTGDELRNWRLYGGDTSMLYRTINRNKKSIVLDLKTERGRGIVLDLLRHCDVLLENFRPGTLEKWGLGPEVLDGVNPGLVITRISGFGQTGPMAQRPGFAAVAEAFGGLRELVGDPDRPPVRVGVSIGDSIAGIYAAFGTVMALFQRERTKVPIAATRYRCRAQRVRAVGDGVAGARLPRLRCQPRASRRPDGGHRAEQRLPVRRRHQHHRRGQQRRDLPALHDDDRPARPWRRSRTADQRRALAAPRRTRRGDRAVVDSARPRRGAEDPRRGRRAERADLYRGRHLRRRTV